MKHYARVSCLLAGAGLIVLLLLKLSALCFSEDNLWPHFLLLMSVALIWRVWGSLKWPALCIAIFTMVLFFLDVAFWHHRIALCVRTWHLIFFDYAHPRRILDSPSGRTRVYVLDDGFLDSHVFACISKQSLHPTLFDFSDDCYKRNWPSIDTETSGWINNRWFVLGAPDYVFAYDDQASEGYMYQVYRWNPQPEGGERTRENFVKMIDELIKAQTSDAH